MHNKVTDGHTMLRMAYGEEYRDWFTLSQNRMTVGAGHRSFMRP